ncbi:hypothetical protein OG601_45195 [Streptomyces sp. NBC_01239]|uniref:hypothetical protein n=1 Tax=Streptomyces sp. NBC_01239 TaxID=2903792 RepID=UPI0022513C69|nr:hypothetical protein [Streptomyces sp. NBC_01239]MCX4817797.1 hypothetical protein [Streptomyces sp. NBC_01239]
MADRPARADGSAEGERGRGLLLAEAALPGYATTLCRLDPGTASPRFAFKA